MCSKEELIKATYSGGICLTDEEVAEVLEYAKREFEAVVEDGEKTQKKSRQSNLLGFAYYPRVNVLEALLLLLERNPLTSTVTGSAVLGRA